MLIEHSLHTSDIALNLREQVRLPQLASCFLHTQIELVAQQAEQLLVQQLCCSQGESLTRQLFGNAFDFIQDFAWLNLGYPILNATLPFTHPHFERLLGNRLVREHANPDFPATLNVTSQSTTSGLDLTGGETTAGNRLQGELAEADFATALSQATVVAGHLLTELRTLWLQHLAYPLLGSFFTRRRCLRFQFFLATTNHFALEDPNLDTDHTISGVRFVRGIVDIGTQGVQRHTTFAIPFGTGNFSTAETTAHLDFDALGTN